MPLLTNPDLWRAQMISALGGSAEVARLSNLDLWQRYLVAFPNGGGSVAGPTFDWTKPAADPAILLGLEDDTKLTRTTESVIVTNVASSVGSVTGVCTGTFLIEHDPWFADKRTLFFNGGTSKINMTATAASLFKNKPGHTQVFLFRNTGLLQSAPTQAPIFTYVGTAVDATVRYQITGDATIPAALRFGGRRLDADTFSGVTATGNMGAGPLLAIAWYDHVTAQKRFRVWGTDYDPLTAFSTTGLSENLDSFYVGIGAFNDAQVANVSMYMARAAFYDSAITLADIQMIEGGLAWEYGCQALLPAGHPYKNAAP